MEKKWLSEVFFPQRRTFSEGVPGSKIQRTYSVCQMNAFHQIFSSQSEAFMTAHSSIKSH